MKSGLILVIASLGAALATACGSSTTDTSDGGGSSGSASSGTGSGASSSGVGSSGTGGSGVGGSGAAGTGAGGSGAATSGGNGGQSLAPTPNDCPPGCNNPPDTCCLTMTNGSLTGTCLVDGGACPSGAGSIACSASADCPMAMSCCITPGTGGAPSTSVCAASCSAGASVACGDLMDCPNMGTGYTCVAIPGTPTAVVNMCVPTEGGAPPPAEAGTTPDTGTGDAPGDAPGPTDAASGG